MKLFGFTAAVTLFAPLGSDDLADIPQVCHAALGFDLFFLRFVFHINGVGAAVHAFHLDVPAAFVHQHAVAAADGTFVTVMAANRGQTEMTNALVRLCGADGTELSCQNIETLPPQTAVFLRFPLENAPTQDTVYTICADEIGTENMLSNNQISLLVNGPEQSASGSLEKPTVEPTDDGSETVTITVTVTAEVEPDDAVTVLAASYEDTGRFLGLSPKTVHAGISCITLEDVPAGDDYRLFLVDGEHSPLCKSEDVE